MKKHVYQPLRYFILTFVFTWVFWLTAVAFNSEDISIMIMIFGMFVPAIVSTVMILKSKDKALICDFKERCLNFGKCKVSNIAIIVLIYLVSVGASILVSLCFGQSMGQFSFAEEFSFDGVSIIISLGILLSAAIFEEVGWRGYGVEGFAQTNTWFKSTLMFSLIWSCWHLPLFWIPGTYQCGLREANVWFMLNFFVSIIPLAFIITWVYLKNEKNIFACVFTHMFINFVQESIAMTAVTKCVQTFVLTGVAIALVAYDKKLFFRKDSTPALSKV